MTNAGVLDRRSVPLVFVASLDAPELTDDDWRHLTGSLRLRPGASLTISDGMGNWQPATLVDRGVEPTGPIRFEPRVEPTLTVGFAPVKATKPEATIAALVELGIDRIVVLTAERSVVRWEGTRLASQQRRWTVAAAQAAMQCRSVWLPEIEGPLSAQDAHGLLGGPSGFGVSMAEPGASPLGQATAVLVGPEGGWAPQELSGRLTNALPGRILRAGTAAVVAGAVLVGRHR